MRIAYNKEIDERTKMPLYDFECEPCAYYTEVRQRMNDPSILECPVCGEKTLAKVFINAPHTFVRGEARTIGQLAEKNYKNMGFYEKQDRKRKDQSEDKVDSRRGLMNDKISENGNIDFEKMENSTPNLPFGPKIVGQNSTSGDMPRSMKPHIGIVTMKIDIRAVNPDGTLDLHVMGERALKKYKISNKAQFVVKGTSEAACIKKLKNTLEKIDNG